MATPDIRTAFIDRIAELGLTQTELAERSGLNRTEITRFLNRGRESIAVPKIEALMEALDLELAPREPTRSGRES